MNYRVEPTEVTPLIDFSSDTGELKITGKSFWEDVNSVYDPAIKWLKDNYITNPPASTTLVVELQYFNTATAKLLLDIFGVLEELLEKGKTAKVEWRYLEIDEDLEEAGEDYKVMTKLPIELVALEDD